MVSKPADTRQPGSDGPKRPPFPLALIHPLGPLFRHLPLSLRRHLLFLREFKKWGNFRKPKDISEKVQWRILNDRRAILTFTQDKLAAKDFAARQIAASSLSANAVIPATYWVGMDVRELRALAGKLPARWVLKPNHSCGRVRLLDSNAAPIDWDELEHVGAEWLKRDEEELVFGHWAYSHARHLLIAEERVGAGLHPPTDFKVRCFGGEPGLYWWGERGRFRSRIAVYTKDGEWLNVGGPYEIPKDEAEQLYPLSVEQRSNLLDTARAISEPFDEMRVDFFLEEGQLFFGELTPYTASGLYAYKSKGLGQKVGALWQLPDLTAHDPREAEWRALLEGTPKGTLQE